MKYKKALIKLLGGFMVAYSFIDILGYEANKIRSCIINGGCAATNSYLTGNHLISIVLAAVGLFLLSYKFYKR